MASKRSLRPDPNFDLLIETLYPNREEYEAHQIKAMEKLNKSQSQAALVHSISEGIKVQSQTRFQRINKRSQNEGDVNTTPLYTYTSESMNDPQPSTSENRNLCTDFGIGRFVKKTKNDEKNVKVNVCRRIKNVDNCMDSADDLELIFKPHPSENDWSFTKFFTDDLKRYLKTSADATGNPN